MWMKIAICLLNMVSVISLPYCFFKNGEIVDKQVGAVSKPVFVEKVKRSCYKQST